MFIKVWLEAIAGRKTAVLFDEIRFKVEVTGESDPVAIKRHNFEVAVNFTIIFIGRMRLLDTT